MTTALTIRTARGDAEDIDIVDAIMRAAFDPRYGEAWTRAQCLGMLSLPGVWLALAEEGGEPVGFTLARTVVDDGELLLLAVRPEARRRGVGGVLVRAVVAEAAARGAARLCLEMRAGNAATRLYEAEGFARCGERKGYYAGPGGIRYDAHSYVRPIPGDGRH